MHGSRFILLGTARSTADVRDTPPGKVLWMLVSPNNRQLGRSATACDSYADALAQVQLVQDRGPAALRVVAPHESTGQWSWSLQVGTTKVAVSSRTYLRLRECHYNLDRFLAALPEARIVATTTSELRRGARR